MALRNYLVGEVAEDFVDGLLTRREALRRLTLLGLSVSSATALLAACGDGGGAPGRSGVACGSLDALASAPHDNPRKNRDDQAGGTGALCRPGR